MIAADSRHGSGDDRARSHPRALFLTRYFALQSESGGGNTQSVRGQRRSIAVYGLICLLALTLWLAGGDRAGATALGLILPGAGFLYWASGAQAVLAIGLCVLTLIVFGAALVTWFATGNIVFPPLLWLAAAGVAGQPAWLGLDERLTQPATGLAIPLSLAAAMVAWLAVRRQAPAAPPMPALLAMPAAVADPREEIAPDDLKRLRLLADRALQPVAAFDGFEWRDQFQTAAVRYQVNFIAYALAVAWRNHLPAATAWLAEAQARLLAKQGDPRLWRYWALENAWGNLRIGRDPIPRGNIMATGFTTLQMALGDTAAPLDLRRRGASWRRYGSDDMAGILAAQYADAPYGLLTCEPHWIYPLCNLITACGLRATDARMGTGHWRNITTSFGERLIGDFTTAGGDFVAFRPSLTGFAAPRLGGALMQTFPCLFLNALYPDLAAAHWQHIRRWAEARGWRRALWPIDVGNYGFSRAAGYAASAAAAVEMGDGETARLLLDLLDADCPGRASDGVTHRPRASLWAHALELVARLGRADGFRHIVEVPGDARAGPHLAEADYPDVLIAAARREGEALNLVLYPGAAPGVRPIAVAGLRPGRHYRTGLADQPFARADDTGRAVIAVPLHARTELRIVPVI